LLRRTPLPADRRAPTYAAALRRRHAAILGVCALVESYPYTVERWMPELLTSVLAECTYDPVRLFSLNFCFPRLARIGADVTAAFL
jgi:proteasome activator subunit 4